MASSGNEAMDDKLWEQVLEERDKGWCRGPHTEDQITNILGHENWLCNRRFVLQQKTKVRDIDDYSEAGSPALWSDRLCNLLQQMRPFIVGNCLL
jgi:hypothetical protein